MTKKDNIYKDNTSVMLPRERIDSYGATTLSDKELISVILGSGVKGYPISAISKNILSLLDKKRNNIEIQDLLSINGLGKAKAMSILAVLELGRRVYMPRKRKIKSPQDILPLLAHYSDREQECFLVYSLNGAHEIISGRIISVGLINRTLVHPREVFREALIENAASVIVAHNHPSGNTIPSNEDIAVTKNLLEASKILNINLLDHIIFSHDDYFSFSGHNKLE